MKIAGIIIGIIGVMLAGLGAFLFVGEQLFLFQIKDGRSVSFEETKCAELESPPDYQVGQKVEVYYDPRDPGNTLQMRKFDYSNAEAATVTGAFFVLFGLGLFWIGWLKGRRAATS